MDTIYEYKATGFQIIAIEKWKELEEKNKSYFLRLKNQRSRQLKISINKVFTNKKHFFEIIKKTKCYIQPRMGNVMGRIL